MSSNAESAIGGAMFYKSVGRLWLSALACACCVVAALFLAPSAEAQTGDAPPAHEVVFYPSGKLRIEAYLYKPEGKGPFPVVIYNHGSRPERERTEMPFAYVGKMLAASGYLVLVPERRGYGKSEGTLFSEEIGNDRGPRYVARLQQEADDVIAAAEFAKTLPDADASRIAVMGWSFGGIVSVFAASRSSLFQVVVDQAGGALSWDGSPWLQSALKDAAGKIRVPLLGMVAENDRTTKSVKIVVEEARKKGDRARLTVYPAFKPSENPNGIAPGHMIFSAQGISLWQSDLNEFLRQEMAH
jgi:dienelactone hydrolase